MTDPKTTARFPAMKAPVAESLTPLLRRLPSYIYLADLFAGKRVLEIGCAEGAGARWLAGAGAQHVVGVDRSASLIDAAKGRHRFPNLEFRVADYGALELEDRSFDVVCVPAGGADLLRWLGFLEEVRRVLVKGGNLIMSVPSADRPDARSGVSYHELTGRLGQIFPDVRVAGVTPFVGLAMVEFADEEELDELALDTSLTRLGSGRDEPTDYLAVAGPVGGAPRGYMVVELPPVEGLDAISLARTTDPGALGRLETKLREAEAAHADALTRARELEQQLKARPEPRLEDSELKRRLAKAVEERTEAELEAQQLRARVERAEEEIGRVAAQAAIELEEARRAAREGVGADVLVKAAEAHLAEVRALEQQLDERTAFADELRAERQAAETRAHEAEARAAAERARADAAEEMLRALRDRLAALEGKNLREDLRPQASGLREEIRSDRTAPDLATDARVATLEAELAEKDRQLARATERWKAAESKTDELWRKIGEMQRELEGNRESAVENARAQRQASQIAITRAVDEASKKLVSVKDELSRANKELARANEDLKKSRDELGAANEEIEQLREVSSRLEKALEHAHEELSRRAAAASAAESTAGFSSQPSEARASQVIRAVASVDDGLRAEEQRLAALEEGIRRMEQAAASRVPVSPEDQPEARIRELLAELGHRDAELAILHGTAAAARRRVGELVEVITKAREEIAGQTGGDVIAALDRLIAQASELAATS